MKKEKITVLMVLFIVLLSASSCKNDRSANGAGYDSTWKGTVKAEEEITEEAGLLTFLVQPVTSPDDMETPFMTKEEFPVMDGSTANIPLGEAIYSFLTGTDREEAKRDLKFNTTPDGYYNLMNGNADLLLVYEPSQLVLKEMQEKGIQLEFKPIGRDALVFIANEKNPVDSLTKKQLIEIYTGRIKNWSEVGGADLEILPFQRPKASGSQTLMEKLAVSAGVLMEGPQVVRPEDMGELIDVLAAYNNDSNALGYSVYFYAKNMYTKPDLKFIGIDGIVPSNESIQSGKYSYINDFYAVIRKDEAKDSNTRKIYDWLTTKEAQEISVQAGYVPIIALDSSENEVGGAYKNPPLNIAETDYIVLHDRTREEVIAGDTLLNKDLKPFLYFPGKEIVTGGNLLCSTADLLVLKSVITLRSMDDYEFKTYGYELYDLETKDYVTKKPYQKIEKSKYGFFICSNFGYHQEETAIFDFEGRLVTEQANSEGERYRGTVAVGEYILKSEQGQIYVLDKTGDILFTHELSYQGYLNTLKSQEGNFNIQSDCAYLDIDGSKILLDQEGKRLPDKKFLSQADFITDIPDIWITDITCGIDGKLVAGGYVESYYIIAKEDGTILFKEEAPRGRYYFSLYPGGVVITGVTEEESSLLFIRTDETAPGSEDTQNLKEMNHSIVSLEKDGFTVYNLENGEAYRVEERNYGTDYFMPTEIEQYGEMFSYNRTGIGEEDKVVSWYKDLIEFKGYAQIMEKNGDYSIIRNEEIYLVADKKGTVWYKGEKEEVIQGFILGKEIYVYSEVGNYAEIKDLNGTILYRQYSPKLSDD